MGFPVERVVTAAPSFDPYRRLPAFVSVILREAERPEGVRHQIERSAELLVRGCVVAVRDADDAAITTALGTEQPLPDPLPHPRRSERLHDLELGRLRLPLVAHGVFLGRLEVLRREPGPITEDEATVLEIFAELSAIVLHSSHLRAVLQHLAWTDELTGLANRRRVLAELRERAEQDLVSLLFIDFDGLKDVNDALGYEAGDGLVRAVGARLAAEAQPGELVGRLGGDELVAVLATGDIRHAEERARRYETVLSELRLEPAVQRLYLGASVGHATLRAGETGDALLSRASEEMRARKETRKSERRLA